MASSINSNLNDGLVTTSDGSGVIYLQSNGITQAQITPNGLLDGKGNPITGGNNGGDSGG